MVMTSVTMAESVTIFNDDPSAQILLNNVLIGTGSVSNFEVEPNEYNIVVKINGESVFNKNISVFNGENRVINTNRFVNQSKSNVANVGARKVEEKRVKQSVKGAFAIGSKFSNISGLSIKWFPIEKYGVQLVGWLSSNGSDSFNAYEARFIYEIDDKLAFTDTLYTLYSGVSYGISSDTVDESSLTSLLGTDQQQLSNSLIEAFIGIEFPVLKIISYGFLEFAYTHNNQTRT